MDPRGGLVIANPIYQEVLPRVLNDSDWSTEKL